MLAGPAILKIFGLLWFAEKMSAAQGAKAAKTTAPLAQQPTAPTAADQAAAAPWPAAKPSTLPPFPSGWELDAPPATDVQTRAAALLPQLWTQGKGAFIQEQTGGRWITYQADTTAGGAKAVVAWRVKGTGAASATAPAPAAAPAQASPVIPIGPAAVNPPAAAAAPIAPTASAAPAAAPAPQSQAAQAAIAMTNALNAHGYRLSDQPVYKAVQRYVLNSANPDGFPGTHTMAGLYAQLDSLGIPKPNVKIYPWLATGGYDGVNAPTLAEWNR